MKKSNKQHILLRSWWVIGAILLFSASIVHGLFETTVVQASKWNMKADSVLTFETPIEPERGKILSDSGTVLAANLNFYTVRIDFNSAGIRDSVFLKNLPALSDSLHAFDDTRTAKQWSDRLMEGFAMRKANNRRARSFRLFRKLTHGQLERLRTFPYFKLGKKKSGLYTEDNMQRVKPYGSMASRSIGTVGESESRRGVHGHSGLESALDSFLYGVPGVAKRIQLNSSISNWVSTPAINGYDVTTTINVQLQDIVETELYKMCHETESRWATAVLMEVATGEIKAISNLEWNDRAQDYVEGRNNAVLGYEPGSVMKPISMMVALEDGTVNNIDQKWETGRTWLYEGRAINDPHGGAALSPREIIETSSNIGMSKIITKKYGSNPGGFYDRLKEMGFFEPFHTGIAGEQVPQIRRLGNTRADRVALTRMCFGYSTLIPPLCTLGMYNAIANDGKYVRPHLVKKFSRAGCPDSIVPITYIRRQVCSPENARKLRVMLHDVVWGDHGTARHWVKSDLVEIAGKTGTAFTILDGKYTHQRRFAFCGFFPYEKPKYSCIVLMLGANRGAGASSGVVMKNIALRMYAHGLLNNKSSYIADADSVKTRATSPTLYASANKGAQTALRQGLQMSHVRTFRSPQREKHGVPDVRGLSLREAIADLEREGLNVRFSGVGYVAHQDMAPGSPFRKGQTVHLQLKY